MELISREDAIKCLEMFLDKQCDRERTKERGFSDNDIWASVNMAYDALTVEKVGKWTRHLLKNANVPWGYDCSACGEWFVISEDAAGRYNYCPICGARMMEGRADDER